MERPLGVTIVTMAMFVAGLLCASAGVIFFLAGSKGAAAATPTSGTLAAVLAALGAAGAIISLFFGAVHILLAIGIFQLRNLARILTIFLFLLIAAGGCIGLIATLLSFSHVSLIWNASVLIVDSLALWYLLRPETKEAFSRAARGS